MTSLQNYINHVLWFQHRIIAAAAADRQATLAAIERPASKDEAVIGELIPEQLPGVLSGGLRSLRAAWTEVHLSPTELHLKRLVDTIQELVRQLGSSVSEKTTAGDPCMMALGQAVLELRESLPENTQSLDLDKQAVCEVLAEQGERMTTDPLFKEVTRLRDVSIDTLKKKLSAMVKAKQLTNNYRQKPDTYGRGYGLSEWG